MNNLKLVSIGFIFGFLGLNCNNNAQTQNTNNDLKKNEINIKDIFRNISKYPVAVRNNGGGYFNHTFYWEGMKASGGGSPTGKLSDTITKSFTSFELC